MGFSILEFDFSFRPLSVENATFWEGLNGVFAFGRNPSWKHDIYCTFTLVNKRYSQTKQFTSLHVLTVAPMIEQHGVTRGNNTIRGSNSKLNCIMYCVAIKPLIQCQHISNSTGALHIITALYRCEKSASTASSVLQIWVFLAVFCVGLFVGIVVDEV